MAQYINELVCERFLDLNDGTKALTFHLTSAAPNTLVTLHFSALSTQTVEIPEQVGTVVGRTLAQSLTNKVISDPSNSVTAETLRSGGTAIPLSGVPLDMQVLSFDLGSNSGTWAHPSCRCFSASADAPTTASAAAFTLVAGMQVTPAVPGTYAVSYDARITAATGNTQWALFNNGVLVPNSLRETALADTSMSTQALVPWTTGTIELRWLTAAGGSTAGARSLLGTLTC